MTRFVMTREMHVANKENLVEIVLEAANAVVYTFSRNGVLLAMAFRGKSQKPAHYFRFPNEDQRAKFVERFTAEETQASTRRKEMKDRRSAERSTPHSLTEGMIMYCPWGYSMSLVDFYMVTKVIGEHMVELTQIGSKGGPEDRGGGAYVVADASIKINKILRKRANGDNVIRMNSFSSSYVWDGKPKYTNHND